MSIFKQATDFIDVPIFLASNRKQTNFISTPLVRIFFNFQSISTLDEISPRY